MIRTPAFPGRGQRGATLIEVLISLVILMIGLLGLIGVMIQSQRAQQEAYQRTQALLLVQDMVARISGNREAADCYVQAAALGTGSGAGAPGLGACSFGLATPQGARALQDLADWKNEILGSAETAGGSNVGSVLGGRGCIVKDATTGVFQISVAWQGMQPSGPPPAAVGCGQGQYGNENLRRAASVTLIPPNAS